MELVGRITAMHWTPKLHLYCFVECFLTYGPPVTADWTWTAQSKCRFLQSQVTVTLVFLCNQPKQHFVAWNLVYILYWDELSKQVEVIKDTCWIECLELTMSEAHMGRGAVQRGLVFSSLKGILIMSYHTCSRDSWRLGTWERTGSKVIWQYWPIWMI